MCFVPYMYFVIICFFFCRMSSVVSRFRFHRLHHNLHLLVAFYVSFSDQEGGASSLVTANNTLNNNNTNNNNNAQATLEKQLERDRADSTLSLLGNNHAQLGMCCCC